MNNLHLQLENVTAGYGSIEVLQGISLVVEQGEIVTIIGANGAGKTSTLMCISGIHHKRGGRISFAGRDLQGVSAHEVVARGVAQVPEGRKIFSRLSVLENLELGAYTRKDRSEIKHDLQRVYQLFPILQERSSQMGGTLSGGEQQMLAIGRALMSRPKMLLLDEPSMGVAPLLVKKIFETIVEINRQGVSVLLVEQNAHLALKIAKRGYVLETGKIVLEAAAEKLLLDPRVKEAYLGEG